MPGLDPGIAGHAEKDGRVKPGHDALQNLCRQLTDTVDSTLHPVAALHRADAGWRAGEDEIAGLQLEQAGEMGDDLRHCPDHLGEIAGLAALAVDLEPDGTLLRMADIARAPDSGAGSRVVECLADLPRPARLLR